MSRVDVPTLKCDRCGRQTQEENEMFRWQTLVHTHASGENRWDLCTSCWVKFNNFIQGVEA